MLFVRKIQPFVVKIIHFTDFFTVRRVQGNKTESFTITNSSLLEQNHIN